MDEAALTALVRLAISCHETTGCVEFVNVQLEQRLKSNPVLQILGTLKEIRALMIDFVLASGPVEFRKETREEYQHRREYWFRVNVPITGFPRPLFFELELTDDDTELPAIVILNVHF
jgi:hypothetical protein